jgi:hypothetical protein
VFPRGATTPSQRNDVEIAFCAWKYLAYLVTGDGGSNRQRRGLLGSRDALAELGVRVIRAEEMVGLVVDQLLWRDRNAINAWKVMGRPLPAWVGQDAPENEDEIRREITPVTSN